MSAELTTVLLIAAHDVAARGLCSLLVKAGHRVERVPSAGEALPRALHAGVIVFDGMPPDLPLDSFCRGLRADPATAVTPVLLLTGWPSGVLPAGLDAFLYHPLCPTQLLGQLDLLARLREARALYQSLVQTLPVAIYRKDAHGRLTFVNRQLCAQLHRGQDELLGRSEEDFAPDDLVRKYTETPPGNGSAGTVSQDIVADLTPEGEARYIQRIQAPLCNPSGQVIGTQGMFWDVTARQRAEEAAADNAVARRIQQKLFPAATSPLVSWAASHGLDLGGASFPAEAVGGDCFDWFPLGWEGVGVALADVSGHGTGAALMMAETRAYLRASASASSEPGEVLARVNQLIADDLEGDRFVTLLLARLDLATRSMVYASAGHATAYILDAACSVKHTFPSLDVPLGVHPQQSYRTSEPVPLANGDIVVLLTDGIAEARDPQGQQFAPKRIFDVVRYYRRASARQIAENLYHAVRAFAQNLPQRDDITAVVVKVQPARAGA